MQSVGIIGLDALTPLHPDTEVGDGWRLVAVGGWWRLAVGGWRRLAVGGGWQLVARGCP